MELDVDEWLARTACRKCHRYGAALNDCLNSVLLTIVRTPGMTSFSVTHDGDAISCSFPFPFRACGRRYTANVTAEGEGFSAEVQGLPGCLTEVYFVDEHYIVDLILKVVTVSVETQKIVAKLPRLEF